VRFSAFILAPIIPNISNKIYNQLGYNLDFNQKDLDLKKGTDKNHFEWGILPLNQNLPKPNPVFIKLELPNLIDKG